MDIKRICTIQMAQHIEEGMNFKRLNFQEIASNFPDWEDMTPEEMVTLERIAEQAACYAKFVFYKNIREYITHQEIRNHESTCKNTGPCYPTFSSSTER